MLLRHTYLQRKLDTGQPIRDPSGHSVPLHSIAQEDVLLLVSCVQYKTTPLLVPQTFMDKITPPAYLISKLFQI